MKHHVTVGVDGSPESMAAARWEAREAALRRVSLRLVHAVDWPISPAIPRLGDEAADRWADEALTDALEDVRPRHPDVEITTRSASSSARWACRRSQPPRPRWPSYGYRMKRRTRSPPGFGEIVVGVDIHEAADKVLAFAFEEASRRDCALRAVHGWKLPSAYEYVPFFDPDNERDIGRSVTQMLNETLLPWRSKFPSVRVTHNAFMGPAGQQLVQASAGADLVVVGRQLRRSPLGAHLGPVAHTVLHHAAAPVAVVAHD